MEPHEINTLLHGKSKVAILKMGIFKNYIPHRGLISKLYEELNKTRYPQNKNPIQIMNTRSREFLKVKTQCLTNI